MKKISVLIPTFNEEKNVPILYNELINIFKDIDYNYEIVFIDNNSNDDTRNIIKSIIRENQNVKAIFNAKNFGITRSVMHGLKQTTGDCTILIYSDLQDPPNLIKEFIKEWENGYKVVFGKKIKSKEGIITIFRNLYYKMVETMSKIDKFSHLNNVNLFGLYDKSVLDAILSIDDPEPAIKNIFLEYSYKIKTIDYIHEKRKHGKSNLNIYNLYDVGMIIITNSSKIFLRMSILFGFFFSMITFFIGVFFLIGKLLNWEIYDNGIASILVGVFFIGSVQIFFIGILGEYILNINSKIIKKPLVIEEERINFGELNSNGK